jgi:hypothetical protein
MLKASVAAALFAVRDAERLEEEEVEKGTLAKLQEMEALSRKHSMVSVGASRRNSRMNDFDVD